MAEVRVSVGFHEGMVVDFVGDEWVATHPYFDGSWEVVNLAELRNPHWGEPQMVCLFPVQIPSEQLVNVELVGHERLLPVFPEFIAERAERERELDEILCGPRFNWFQRFIHWLGGWG